MTHFRYGRAALLAVVGILLAVSRMLAATAGTHPLDDWLATHPAVANAMIWEFPPPPERLKVHKISVPLVWRRFDPAPYPGIFPPVSRSSFSDELIGAFVRTRVTFTDLVEGLDPSPIVTTVKSPAPSNPLHPGVSLEFIPAGIKKSEYGAEIRSWSMWPEAAKQQLRDRFDAYAEWAGTACPLYAQYAATQFTTKPAGFDAAFSYTVDLDPAPVLDPPVNLQPDDPAVDGVPWTMIGSDPAFALYVRHVAAQLAMELNGCLPWSLGEYPAADLPPLFDGRGIFRYLPAGPSAWGAITATGHGIMTSVTPAPPLVTLGFLGQHGLIGASRLDTLTRLLQWERQNLQHVLGGATAVPYGNGEFYWGYNGPAPVSRMINGTIMAGPLTLGGNTTFYNPQPAHWVGGCGGASGFTAEALKMLNVAAERTVHSHFQNRFALGGGEHVATAHADDPYSLASAPEIPTADILLDDPTFQAWFADESDPQLVTKNVSRRAADLWLQYLPQTLLDFHCLDVAAGRSHAQSLVYGWVFVATYSVAEMESKGLWTGIEAKLAASGGCGAQ